MLYLVHTDSIVGPTVAIPDAFGDTPPNVGGPSIPNVDYIFLSIRQRNWAQIWESLIMFQEHKVKGPDGYESNCPQEYHTITVTDPHTQTTKTLEYLSPH
jgi:hypothetical protein